MKFSKNDAAAALLGIVVILTALPLSSCKFNEKLEKLSSETTNKSVIKRDSSFDIYKDLNKAILFRLNLLNAFLNYLIKTEDVHSRNQARSNDQFRRTRSASFLLTDHVQCTASQYQLEQLKISIENSLSKKDQKISAYCDSNDDSLDCKNLFKLIQCKINLMKIDILRAQDRSLEDKTNIISTYNEDLENMQKILGNKIKALSKDYQDIIDKLSENVQKLLNDFNMLLQNYISNLAEVLAFRITKQKASEALIEFKKSLNFSIDPLAIIDNTIDKSYHLEHMESILTFIRSLLEHEYIARGYKKLYEKIKENKDEKNLKIIKFYDAAMSDLEDQNYMDLKKKIKMDVINPWAMKMRNNDCKQIREFAKEYTGNRTYQEDLVKITYGKNMNNLETILNCIRNMPNTKDLITMYPVLYEEMRRNDQLDTPQLITLAYYTKEIEEISRNQEFSQNYKDKITALKENLPSAVRRIIWDNSSCFVKNFYTSEYFYTAVKDYNYDSQRRQVFTWRPKTWDSQMLFTIEPSDSAQYFHIKSKYYQEYLYAADYAKFDSRRRRVFTWIPGETDEMSQWILEPQKSATLFKIKSKRWNEYLYADEESTYNKNRRRVFTLMSGNSTQDAFLWEIQCFSHANWFSLKNIFSEYHFLGT